MSYLELLIKLKGDIESDIIPASDKAKILSLVEQLERVLWKYSD